ncbi:MAG: DUF4910 domain-containing protein [Oceanospirillaceae bacterium]|nr:DUF4910 domain-containing protein [Oceanospirillaceae bacterium]
MYELASELFPICRSLTGNGVRATLDILRREISDLKIFEVSTGTKCFDWHVPEEWNIRDAYIKSPNGKKIIDFNKSNLHVVGYSEPINTKISLENLQDHLYSLPNQPDAIPYVTSYYKKQWGFSLAHNQRKNLSPGEYEVFIDSDHKSGSLTYGEIVIKGESDKEVFLSTYICHPSMANNELSGPVVTSALIKWIKSLKKTLYTYRIIFVPETIGAIVYLSKNMSVMKLNTVAGFNITCVGDDREYSYLPSRDGNTLSDRISKHVLKYLVGDYKAYSFLERGSDERQYCSPGVDLPVASIMRSKYHTYPEYHTSKDDLTFISPAGLFGSYNVLKYCLDCIEKNKIFKVKVLCEPQLGKRGLYPDTSIKGSAVSADTIMNFLAYCDGNVDLLCIADKINEPMWNLFDIVDSLLEADLIEIVS